jgi:hypothetical protein
LRPVPEADQTKGGISLRDADPEAEIVVGLRQLDLSAFTRSRIAIAIRTARKGGSVQGIGSLKITITSSPIIYVSVP